MRRRRLPEAIAALREHLDGRPDDLKAMLELGICHLLNGSEELFLGIHDRAVRLIAAARELPVAVLRLWQRYCGLLAKVTAVALVVGTTAGAALGQYSGHKYSGGVYLPPAPEVRKPVPPSLGAFAGVSVMGGLGAAADAFGPKATALVPQAAWDPLPTISVTGQTRADTAYGTGLATSVSADGTLEMPIFGQSRPAHLPVVSASAFTSTVWEIAPGSLPEGTPITVRVAVRYDGTLEYTYSDWSASSAAGELKVYRETGNGFAGSPSAAYYGYVHTRWMWGSGYSDWAGDVTWGETEATLRVNDLVSFPAVVGEQVRIDFALSVGAFADNRYGTDAFPVHGDVSLTASYGFVIERSGQILRGDEAAVRLVPEPAALVILCLGALPCLCGRRGRSTRAED